MQSTDKDNLILISPKPSLVFQCVHCDSVDTKVDELLFQGIHLLAKCFCNHCGDKFFHTLPIGHDLLFPIAFDETGKKIKTDKQAELWLANPLIKSIFENEKINVPIEKEVFEQKANAVILNCLDNCYGHSLDKLFMFFPLKKEYAEYSIIVFIPKNMRWLVPEGVSEVWSFDASLKDFGKLPINLDGEVKQNLLPRFNTVSVPEFSSRFDLSKIDWRALVKTDRFDLNKFYDANPQITFGLREDRLWHRSALEYFLFRVFNKFKLSKKIFVWRQIQLINKTARLIKAQLPDAKFVAVGLGKKGKLISIINDQRKKKLSADEEMQWCKLYSTSHVVIGVHGSNMMISTALSAGFIEILPRHKIQHIAEDTYLNYSSRFTTFLGRHVDHYASPRLVSQHAVRMIKDFSFHYKTVLNKNQE